MKFLTIIGNAIWAKIEPQLLDSLNQIRSEVTETIKAEIREHMPAIIEAVVKAVAQSAGQIAVTGVDKVTDMIPGDLDDKIIDPIVKNVLGDVLKRFGL